MPFQFPSAEDPFFKRFFIMIALFIEFFVEVIFPGVVAFVLLAAIVLFCGNMLGLTQDSPSETCFFIVLLTVGLQLYSEVRRSVACAARLPITLTS